MSESIYQPLTVAEIEELLYNATYDKEIRDTTNVARIQVRLIDGIKGMESPRQTDGLVANKMLQIEKKFVDFVNTSAIGGTNVIPSLAAELHAIMES